MAVTDVSCLLLLKYVGLLLCDGLT